LEIDAMLARLAAVSADHFETSPDEIPWGHVGTLNHYRAKLREITDMAFREGEHAGITHPAIAPATPFGVRLVNGHGQRRFNKLHAPLRKEKGIIEAFAKQLAPRSVHGTMKC
jgi:hypothetical protein